MNWFLKFLGSFLVFSLCAYKFGFTVVYYFLVYFPGFIFRTMHPVEPYHYVELGHVALPKVPHGVSLEGLRRPNIILIVADDLAINDLSGNGGVLTPNIDSIAKNGVNFVNAYSGQATCAPSRASLYTGRYPTRFGFEFTPVTKVLARMLALPKKNAIYFPVFHREIMRDVPPMTHMVVPRNQTMIAEMLQDEGYLTYFLGKWHLGETVGYRPVERGFTESLCFLMGASQYVGRDNKSVIAADLANNMFIDDFLRINLPFSVTHNNQPDFKPNEYMTDYLSKAVVKLIHNRHQYNQWDKRQRFTRNAALTHQFEEVEVDGAGSANSAHAASVPAADGVVVAPKRDNRTVQVSAEAVEEDQPFFVTVAYNAPHNPMQALLVDYYSAELNATFDNPDKPYIPEGSTEPLTKELTHTARVYAAMIMSMDRGVGQIIEALKETNQLDNTLIMFTSDNGGAAYLGLPHINYPYRGWKASFFEGGVRVPFFMQWPAVIKPSAADAVGTDKKTQGNKHLGGIVSDVVVSHVDVFATIAAAASVGGPALPTVRTGNSGEKQQQQSETVNNTFKREDLSEVPGVAESEDLLSEASQMASKFIDNVTTVGSAIMKEHYATKLFKKLIKGVLFVYREAVSVPKASRQELNEYHSLLHNPHSPIEEVMEYVRNTTAALLNKTSELLPLHAMKFNRRTRSKKSHASSSSSSGTEESESSGDESSNHSEAHSEYMIDGINLLPYVASPLLYRESTAFSSEEVLHSHFLLANNASVADRVLFWRSGNYAAVQQPSTQYKLQVSEKLVDKIWFCHLGTDPYEHVNIAMQLNITTVGDLEQSRTIVVSDPTLKVHKEHLYLLYDELLHLQRHQSRPLWPALIEFPTAIDKTAMEDEVEGDEYIYWAN